MFKENRMIQCNRLDTGFYRIQTELEEKALEVLRSGWYIMGNELKTFEHNFAKYNNAEYCVGLASGLDALILAFNVLGIGPGDEVIVQANTYIASVMGITRNGATPVFVEPDMYYGLDADKIEEKITERTKAILVVHLYGQSCQMDQIVDLCKKYNLKLVEDCAQSHGAHFGDKKTGTFGDIGCFSFYPTKNLGAFGDAGAIITNDSLIDADMRMYRNYGSEKRYYNKVVGYNSRLDEIQAGLLDVRLKYLDEMNEEKAVIANRYFEGIDNNLIELPKRRDNADHIFHQFVIKCDRRDDLMNYLKDEGIGTIIHYPIPPHLSEAYSYLGYKKGDFPIAETYADSILSIPMYYGLSIADQDTVIKAINRFK